MTKHITLKEWQATFKTKSVIEPPKVPSKNETDKFSTRLDGIIADAGRVAVRKYQSKIQSALYQIDRSFASVATDLVQQHCPEEIYKSFNDAWSELKKLIWEIEIIGSESETSTTNT